MASYAIPYVWLLRPGDGTTGMDAVIAVGINCTEPAGLAVRRRGKVYLRRCRLRGDGMAGFGHEPPANLAGGTINANRQLTSR